MKRLFNAISHPKFLSVGILLSICLVAARGWLNRGLPAGHDVIGQLFTASAVKDLYLTTHDMADQCVALLSLPSMYVGPPALDYCLAALSLVLGWAVATKSLFLVLFVLASVFAYYYVYKLTGKRTAGVVAGLAYVFSPYFLIEVVFEGHWSIGVTYALLPALLLATDSAISTPKPLQIGTVGLLLGLLIIAGHPQTLPILIGPFWCLYVLFRVWLSGRQKARSTVLSSGAAILTGMSLAAFWWLPLLTEIAYFRPAYSQEHTSVFAATFGQAITLRPSLCCASTSAYEASTSAIVQALRLIPVALVVLGAILNIRSRYVWFFSLPILTILPLSMGSFFPIDIFGFAQQHLPFFSGIRTPARLLIVSSFAYAVLIGFATVGLINWLNKVKPQRLRRYNLTLVIPLLLSLIVLANTWQEARQAFTTLDLPHDRLAALEFLTEQQDGDYRVADAFFTTDIVIHDSRYTKNPTYWVFSHQKETLPGGIPQTSLYATNVLESLHSDLERGRLNMSEWFSTLNVKFVVVDKTNPLYTNLVLDEYFEQVWTSETIDIHENHALKPRVLCLTVTDERTIDLYTGDVIHLTYSEGTQAPMLSLSDDFCAAGAHVVKSAYRFTNIGDHLCLELNVQEVEFRQEDAIHLTFYSQYALPDVHVSLGLFEEDGSRYDVVLNSVDGIRAGWNEVNYPISLLNLRYSTDENDRLDLDQIERLYIGVGKQYHDGTYRDFELYFDKLSIVTHEINPSLEYTKIRPGEYKVHITTESPCHVVLAESYHPHWVARAKGTEIRSEIIYECLNSFYLEPGEYELTIEFVNSPLRTAGNLITLITVVGLLGGASFILCRAWRRKRAQRPGLPNPPTDET